MKHSIRLLAGLAVLSARFAIASAAEESHFPASVAPDAFDFKALLGDPPADNSDAHKAELARMLELQKHRTADDIRRCRAEVDFTAFSAFGPILGKHFTADELPKAAKLMDELEKQEKAISKPAKDLWNRPRPFTDPTIHPCVKPEKSAAYPSGHSDRSMLYALVLSDLLPTHRDELIAEAKHIGDDRQLAGMHWPSDVAAGQKLGAEIARRLLADHEFEKRLDEVKDELAAAHVK